MRLTAALAASAVLAAVPASAQDLYALERSNELRVEQQMANQRAIALENEFQALDARLRTEQALRDLRDQAAQPYVRIPRDPSVGPALAPIPGAASIPDDRLAASNARVRAAAQNRR